MNITFDFESYIHPPLLLFFSNYLLGALCKSYRKRLENNFEEFCTPHFIGGQKAKTGHFNQN